jgi:hypothetical protein
MGVHGVVMGVVMMEQRNECGVVCGGKGMGSKPSLGGKM